MKTEGSGNHIQVFKTVKMAEEIPTIVQKGIIVINWMMLRKGKFRVSMRKISSSC